jgi:HSP20 family protein
MLSFPEVNEFSDHVRRLFEEFDRRHAAGAPVATGIYTPALDVLETATSVEVIVDLPGVPATSVRVFFKDGALVIAGEKLPPEHACPTGAAFHLVERGFGRFARVLRLGVAVDAGRARARLRAGQLQVSVPRLRERRGEEIVVAVEAVAS